MQIEGVINSSGVLLMPIKVIGSRKRALLWGIVDTVFSGYMSLPVDVIANLGMELRGSTDYQLADGSVKQYLVFNTKIRWKGRAKRIEAILTFSEEILLGTKLFEKAKLIADYKTGKCQIEF